MSYLLHRCSTPGCPVSIRTSIEHPISVMKCKWCENGTSSYAAERKLPEGVYGMPDPDLPWPWQTDEERERRLKLPYWRERMQNHPEVYAKWLGKKNP